MGLRKKFSSEGSGGPSGVEMILRLTRSVTAVQGKQDSDQSDQKKEGSVTGEIVAKTPKMIWGYGGVVSQEDLKKPLSQETAKAGPHGVVGMAQIPYSEKDTGDTTQKEETLDADAEKSKRPGKLVVVGSTDVFSNQGMKLPGATRDFMGSLVSYMVRDENFVSIPLKEFEKGDLNMSSQSSQFIHTLIVLIYPFLFLGIALYYVLRRKRKAA